MTGFSNINEVITYFSREDRCRDFLEKMRWPDGKIICPSCGQSGAYRSGDMKHYRCKSRTCNSRFTVTVGTVMENTKLPYSKWLTAIYFVTAHKKGISSIQLAKNLGIGQKAAWFLIHRIRQMVKDNAPDKLQNTVEIDETYVGGKWANMSKKKRAIMQEKGLDNKIAVMGMVEREGYAKLTVIGKNSFKDVIRKHVSTDAFINTDNHAGYEGLNKEFADHAAVNHSIGEFKRDGVHTNTIEGFFSLLKRMIYGTYHQVSPKHLQRYCDELTFRFNTRDMKDTDRFVASLKQTQGRLKYKDLIAKNP